MRLDALSVRLRIREQNVTLGSKGGFVEKLVIKVIQRRLAVSILLVTSMAGCEAKQQAALAPPSVEFIEVAQKDVPITKEWVATLDGFVNAQIRAQVKGLLLKQYYTNGAFVSKDSPLFEIDPRPFQAELDQATANLQQANANLQRAQAQLGKTELDVARYTPLAK